MDESKDQAKLVSTVAVETSFGHKMTYNPLKGSCDIHLTHPAVTE